MSTLYDKICKYLNNNGHTNEPTITVPNPMGIPNGELGLLDEAIVYWNVDGIPQPTIEQLEALQPQIDIEQSNAEIKSQIEALEQSQLRALREMALEPNSFAQSKLAQIDSEIKELRTQIKE